MHLRPVTCEQGGGTAHRTHFAGVKHLFSSLLSSLLFSFLCPTEQAATVTLTDSLEVTRFAQIKDPCHLVNDLSPMSEKKRVDWHLERQLIVQRKEIHLPFLSPPCLSWFDEPSLSLSLSPSLLSLSFFLSPSISFFLSLFCETHAVIKVLHVSSSLLAGAVHHV